MTAYRFCFINRTANQPQFSTIRASSDGEARRIALYILRESPQIERVEVCRDGEFAFRVNQHQVHLEMIFADPGQPFCAMQNTGRHHAMRGERK